MCGRHLRGRLGCFAFAPLMLLFAALVWGEGTAEVKVEIKNADFETADPTGKLPADWVYIAPRDGEGFLTLGEGRNLGHSAQVTCTTLRKPWGPGFGQVNVVSTKGNQWYEVRFWARAEGLIAGAIVALRDVTNWDENRLWQVFYPGPTWREFRFRFYSFAELPATVSRFQFSFDSTGTLWIDDVAIVEAEAGRPANVLDVTGRKNLLPNGSFEVGAFGWATYGADQLFGEVDSSTAAEGRHSFRITLDLAKLPVYYNDFTYQLGSQASHTTLTRLPLCPVGYCPVEKSKPVTFSFYAKASRAGLPIATSIIDGTGKTATRTFNATTDWQRFSFAAIPDGDMAFVTVGIDATPELALPATLWVDALQLELGRDATAYQPTFPVEFALETGREGNVYMQGEKVAPQLILRNATDRAEAVHVSVDVEDFFGHKDTRYSQHVSVGAGGRWAQQVDLGVTQPGFYRLHVTVSGDGWRTTLAVRSAVIFPVEQKYAADDGYLGINHAFVSEIFMRRARAMGVSWVRGWFCKWEDVEQRQGIFYFSEADTQYERLRNTGVRVQLCLSDPSSEWASTAPETLTGTTAGEGQSRRRWWLPKSFDDYENYVGQVARHFEGKVKHYEVFNEPTESKGGENCNLELASTYAVFLERAGRAIRSVSGDNRLMGAGLHYLGGVKDLSTIVSRIDILSEHWYPGLAPTADAMKMFADIRETLDRSGGQRPIWVTEYGIYADDDPDPTTVSSHFTIRQGRDSERLAATYAVKHHVVMLASGVQKIFFHIGNWPFYVNREHGCCFHPFFEWGGVPRKTYVTLNTLAWMLPPGSVHVKTWTGPHHFFAFEFGHGDTRTVVLWSDEGFEVPDDGARALWKSGVEIRDVSGAELKEPLQWLSDSPIYVRAVGQAQRSAVARFVAKLTEQ